MTLACLFPGQGTQSPGMGRTLAAAYPAAARIYAEADARLDFPLSQVCWSGPDSRLGDITIQQLAIFTTSVAAFQAARSEGFHPRWVAGISLGGFAAAVAAGALSFADGLRAVAARGRCMAAHAAAGGMYAIWGLPRPLLNAVLEDLARRGVAAYRAVRYGTAEHLVACPPEGG
ncbi:MAG: acyltransferase domain-containing protein, partial [Firmicutes bacterium]|nr:acyltransferase domain-containing protein [Bacillota bacterium]